MTGESVWKNSRSVRRFVAHPVRDVPGSDHVPGLLAVSRLVIEENVGGKCFKESRLVQAAEEQRFIQPNVPFTQGTYHPLMRGSRTRGDQRRADRALLFGKFALQLVQGRQKGLERPTYQRIASSSCS